MVDVRFLVALVVSALAGSGYARTFTDDKGRKIEAEIIDVDGADVTIETGGKKFTLPIARFSAADQEFVRKWVAEKAAKPADPPSAAAADYPEAGATLRFTFPELEKDFGGKPAAFTAKVPKGYDPTKPVPLMIFLGGGKGTGSPTYALSVTRDDFVCAGLPYPDSGRDPRQKNKVGRYDVVWNYWQPMLAKLKEAIPNLDPNIWIIGGFSNGAHAIDGLLAEEEFTATFSAFILVEGGGTPGGRFPGAKGKPMYYAWGEKSPMAYWAPTALDRAKGSGMKLHSHEMKGVGHKFPSSEKEAVTSWLYETVLPGLAESR